MNKKFLLSIACLGLTFSLAGCGKKKEEKPADAATTEASADVSSPAADPVPETGNAAEAAPVADVTPTPEVQTTEAAPVEAPAAEVPATEAAPAEATVDAPHASEPSTPA